MNIETMIYLAHVLPEIGGIFTLFSLFGTIIVVGTCFFKKMDAFDEEEHYKVNVFFKNYIVKNSKWVFLLFLIGALFPSEKTIYLILGAHYLKDSTLPSKVEIAIDKKIDEYLKEDGK
jgi:hypothetical protein